MNHGNMLQITQNQPTMKISELRQIVFKIESKYGPDVPVFLHDEEMSLLEGYDEKYHAGIGYDEKYHAGITDVRIVEDWPLPGNSVMHDESEKANKVKMVIFERWIEDPAYIDSSADSNND